MRRVVAAVRPSVCTSCGYVMPAETGELRAQNSVHVAQMLAAAGL